MSKAKTGDTVAVHYTGTLKDGTTFDSSQGREPLEFKLGEGRVIPGFENGVLGMEIGEKKTVIIPTQEAYGEFREDMKQEVPRSYFQSDFEPQVGQQVKMDRKDGQSLVVLIAATTDKAITIDANHPLAGKELTFNLELVKIK